MRIICRSAQDVGFERIWTGIHLTLRGLVAAEVGDVEMRSEHGDDAAEVIDGELGGVAQAQEEAGGIGDGLALGGGAGKIAVMRADSDLIALDLDAGPGGAELVEVLGVRGRSKHDDGADIVFAEDDFDFLHGGFEFGIRHGSLNHGWTEAAEGKSGGGRAGETRIYTDGAERR